MRCGTGTRRVGRWWRVRVDGAAIDGAATAGRVGRERVGNAWRFLAAGFRIWRAGALRRFFDPVAKRHKVINEGLVATALLWDESIRREEVWVVDDLQHAAAGAAAIHVFRRRAGARGRVRAATLVFCDGRRRRFKDETGIVGARLWQVGEVGDT